MELRQHPVDFSSQPEYWLPTPDLVAQVREHLLGGKNTFDVQTQLLQERFPHLVLTCSVKPQAEQIGGGKNILVVEFNAYIKNQSEHQTYPFPHWRGVGNFVVSVDGVEPLAFTAKYENETRGKNFEAQGVTQLFSPLNEAIVQALADLLGQEITSSGLTTFDRVREVFVGRGFQFYSESELPGYTTHVKARKVNVPQEDFPNLSEHRQAFGTTLLHWAQA